VRVGRVGLGQVVAGLGGGLLVISSFTFDAGRILAGGTPSAFAWPVFIAGMALAVAGVASALRVPLAQARDAEVRAESRPAV
jgi:hypothetical protein